jgi:hypothetical protein
MNTPVSFELAQLLKEKKFNEPCLSYWKDLNLEGHRFKDWNNETIGDSPMHKRNAGYYSAPTIAQVVMWLYEKYGIWISVDPENGTDTWFFTISYNNSETIFGNYSTPTEAYSAALDYIKENNLIK